MAKKILITVTLLMTAILQVVCGDVSSAGAAHGTGCSEKSFQGDTVSALLKSSNGQSTDGIEIMFYPEKEKKGQQAFKAKRLHINAADRTAYPAVHDDGSCILVRMSQPPMPSDLKRLLTADESIVPIFTVSDVSRISSGAHFTIGIYRIIKN